MFNEEGNALDTFFKSQGYEFSLATVAPGFQQKRNTTTFDLPFFFVTGAKSETEIQHQACGPPSVGLTLR